MDYFNRKLVMGAVITLVLLWAGNFYYYKSHSLEKPLFMKHYYQAGWGDEIPLDLYYLNQINNKKDVTNIMVPGLEYNQGYSCELYPVDVQQFNHLYLKKVILKINKKILMTTLKEDQLVINQVYVNYTDGTLDKVDLGELRINLKPMNKQVITPGSSGSTNNDSGFVDFLIDSPFLLKAMDIPFKERLAGHLKITVNEQEIKNLSAIGYPVGTDRLHLKYTFNFSPDDKGRYQYFNIDDVLHLQQDNGAEKDASYIIHYTPSLTMEDVRKIVKEREGWW